MPVWVFTLAWDQAVEKLSSFQLYAGAWALKMVQCAVAGGASRVQFLCTDEQVMVRVLFSSSWTANEVRDALVQLAPPGDRSLGHLVLAFRALAFGEQRDVELYLAGQHEGLRWSQGRLEFCRREKALDHLRLLVAHPAGGKVSRGSSAGSARWSNADVIRALSKHCFAAPIPVDADGLRVDGLWEAPGHGRAPYREILALAFPAAELPALALSPRTFEKATVLNQEEGLPSARPSEASLSVILSAYTGRSSGQTEVGHSHLFWILDGVTVGQEVWPLEAGPVTMGWVLSAQGLGTDLSTLSLLEDEEYARRKREAWRAAGEFLAHAEPLADIRETVLRARRDHKLPAKVMLGLGFLIMPLFPLSVPLLLGGIVMLNSGDEKLEDGMSSLQQGLERLREGWQSCKPSEAASTLRDP